MGPGIAAFDSSLSCVWPLAFSPVSTVHLVPDPSLKAH